MSGKRCDSKNRILRKGESQRQGRRYAFKYIDATGKQQSVYSWKLERQIKRRKGNGTYYITTVPFLKEL